MAGSRSSGPKGYLAGEIYSFKTSPLTEFSTQDTGRYAALKILGDLDDGTVCYAVLEGIFDRHPRLEDLANSGVLSCNRFFGRGEPAVSSTRRDWTNDLEDLRYVGHAEISEVEADLRDECRSFGTWNSASFNAEGEWRWWNDREQVKKEVAQSEAARDEKARAEREFYENRLKGLSWNQLLEEEPFPNWEPNPPFPPPAFAAQARVRILLAIQELRELGAKPKKRDVRAVLKSCVEWFNAKDAEFGEVIMTEEREDICKALFELAVIAGHRSLMPELDQWRTW